MNFAVNIFEASSYCFMPVLQQNHSM